MLSVTGWLVVAGVMLVVLCVILFMLLWHDRPVPTVSELDRVLEAERTAYDLVKELRDALAEEVRTDTAFAEYAAEIDALLANPEFQATAKVIKMGGKR